MGKITGFMDYPRRTSTDAEPLARLENFNEFHTWLPREEQQTRPAAAWTAACPSASRG